MKQFFEAACVRTRPRPLWFSRFSLLVWLLVGASLQGQEPPAGDLERLMLLSADGATRQGGPSAGDWASRCQSQMQLLSSYRSWLIKRDYTMPHLQSRGFAYVEWRMDVARPDRLHVRQVIHEQEPLGELREERIAVGSEHFIGGNSWTRVDAQSASDYATLNRFLLLDKFGDLFQKTKFNLLGTVTAGGRRYAVLESDNARITGHAMLAEFEKIKGRARVWIDEETGQLAKVEIEYRGKDAAGEPLHKGFVQVFGSLNQPLAINPPAVKP